MFKIIGADDRQYGPIPTEQLRQWILEGRAGSRTQVLPEGSVHWVALGSLPEFAALFQSAPPLSLVQGLPPVVRTFGVLNLVVAALLFLSFLSSLFTMWSFMTRSGNASWANATWFFFTGVSFIGIILRVVSGVGLLRGREWARRLAVCYAAFAIVMGLYGHGRTIFWMMTNGGSIGPALRSPAFLFNLVLSASTLAFNILTVVLLSRKPVREALVAIRSNRGAK